MWGAHEVDGRIAAKNAVKIRAALRQSVDARQVYDQYQSTQPAVSDNPVQDRARARAWALLNIRLNNESLRAAILRLYAEAWVTGEAAANEAIGEEEELAKALDSAIDWSKWNPGDAASALLLDPPKAFQDLVESTGSLIRGLDRTGYELIGTALADSIRAGYAPKRAAKLIQDAVGSPARALTIAVTESSRVMNNAAIGRYKDAGINEVKWMVVMGGGTSVACEKCAQNDGQVVQIGSSFNSGNTQPPAHPHCRCNLRPVVPDYADVNSTAGSVDIAPSVVAPPVVAAKPIKKPAVQATPKKTIPVTQDFQQLANPDFRNGGKQVTQAQAAALAAYRGNGYASYDQMNAWLRGRRWAIKNPEDAAIMKKTIEERTAAIDELMAKAPVATQEFTSYRGFTGSYADELSGLKPGQTFTDLAFSSTTLDANVAKTQFAEGGVVVEVVNPQGTQGIMMKGFFKSDHYNEQEWLLPRNSTFKVISKQVIQGTTVIKAVVK